MPICVACRGRKLLSARGNSRLLESGIGFADKENIPCVCICESARTSWSAFPFVLAISSDVPTVLLAY